MSGISLIVEGDDDIKFLQDFILKHFMREIDKSHFIKIGGKSETIHLSSTLIESSTAKGKRNILIFDADESFDETISAIRQKEGELSLTFNEVFLFPDNHSIGNLEVLLNNCIPIENLSIFDCIKNYSNCTKELGLKLREIDSKEELYIYHGSFVRSGNSKGVNRDYLNSEIWNLESESIQTLKEFLSPHFI